MTSYGVGLARGQKTEISSSFDRVHIQICKSCKTYVGKYLPTLSTLVLKQGLDFPVFFNWESVFLWILLLNTLS